jgi:SSS family solute:Na+ symporter
MALISLYEVKRGVIAKGLEIDSKMFRTDRAFAVGSLIIIGILIALYSIYW